KMDVTVITIILGTISIIALVIYILFSKKKENGKGVYDESSLPLSKKSDEIFNLLPLRQPDKDGEGFAKKDGKYMNIISVNPQDYPNLSEIDTCKQASYLDMFFRVYNKGFSFFSINMIIDTSSNIRFFNHKKEKARKKVYKRILDANIKEMENMKVQTKQYYLKTFADSYEEMKENNKIAFDSLAPGGLIEPLSPDDKENVIRKINNPYGYVYYV
ncbi:MAG: hypothetical protein J1E41_06050, partial [Ruminococcus sp.]|nr:hypothetical protein [Ruminococcus sp.]